MRPPPKNAAHLTRELGARPSGGVCQNLQTREFGARPHSPGMWMNRHLGDRYYRKAHQVGYRSRAAYKLRQMDDQFGIFRKGQTVLDLGCWNGGWSQVAVQRTVLAGGKIHVPGSCPSTSSDDPYAGESNEARVIGVDLLRMDPLDHHEFIQGDITQASTLESIVDTLGAQQKADVIISDLCPPMTGRKQDDHLNSTELCLAATDVMERVLRVDSCVDARNGSGGVGSDSPAPRGSTWLVMKTFYGPETQKLQTYLESRFRAVCKPKPAASRDESREIYIVCAGYIGRSAVAFETGAPDPGRHRSAQRAREMRGKDARLQREAKEELALANAEKRKGRAADGPSAGGEPAVAWSRPRGTWGNFERDS